MPWQVANSLDVLEPLYSQPSKAKDRLAKAMPILSSTDGPFGRLNSAKTSARATAELEWLAAASLDVGTQQGWGLFNPSRALAASEWQFSRFREVGLISSLKVTLAGWEAWLSPCPRVPDICIFPMPADPANYQVMVWQHGLTGVGGSAGNVILVLWPSDGNMRRLAAFVGRLIALAVRWHQVPEEPLTLANLLAAEGLAAKLVEAQGQVADGLSGLIAPADHDLTLAHIAKLHGVPRYAEMRLNTYGSVEPAGHQRAPLLTPIDDEEQAYSWTIMSDHLTARDPRVLAACLYGDPHVAHRGHARLGLSPFAGLQVARWLVGSTLAARDVDPRQAIAWPACELLGRS